MYREDDILYRVMQLIPGADLSKLWDELSCNEKASICDQPREIFTQIRTIPSPGYFGSVTGGPVQHRFFEWMDEDPRINGPFETSENFHLGMALHSQKQEERNDHPSTFTHSDLLKQNIMVQELPQSDGHSARQFEVTGIIDWEMAGWYPRYWEYAAFFVDSFWAGEWEKKIESFILSKQPF
ncbi:Phosphotransferase enzyme family protein [Aspergillus parasiticus SU-1]|uniref:Phosphotransferase enzyme family protein n=1 Tax=Aspergillus parasiticus (strain ATCC 56775 / NRRL 5862 / SRRC 143 / SU-1) TaxID=1403190 RepID=A0A0F0IC44_ASPPU|nr:Phosphotransferase enzyme family protein [Aspergillus parasiticus SU-1]